MGGEAFAEKHHRGMQSGCRQVRGVNSRRGVESRTFPGRLGRCGRIGIHETVTNAVEEAVAPASASATVTNDVAAVNPPPSPRVLSKEEQIFSNRYARAMSGDSRYKRWLANQYYAGTEFAKRNARLARQLYREAGESGDVRSMAYYAAMAENGEGGDWNVSDAIAWYRKAAEGGHADAMYRTGLACWNDRDSSDELVTEANAWFRKAKAAKCTFVNVDAWIRKTESAPAADSRQPAYAE